MLDVIFVPYIHRYTVFYKIIFYCYFLVPSFGFKEKLKINRDALLSIFFFIKPLTKKRKCYKDKTATETREQVDHSYLCCYIMLRVN